MFETVFNLEFSNRIVWKNDKVIKKSPLIDCRPDGHTLPPPPPPGNFADIPILKSSLFCIE